VWSCAVFVLCWSIFGKWYQIVIILQVVKRRHIAVWNLVQKHKPQKTSSRRKRLHSLFDETQIKVAGAEQLWLWIALLLSPKLGNSSQKKYHRREPCPSQYVCCCCWAWLTNMESIRFQQMYSHGIRKHASSWKWNNISIHYPL
jgi:hypothetical protein